VTDHTAQGRTVHTGLAVITGSEDRQHAYVALTRGTDANLAYVFTQSPKQADAAPGPRPAPELARYDRLARHASIPGPAAPAADETNPLGVLAGVLHRDGQQLSATQARQQALADADHLALLHAIWTAETAPARHQRYQDLLDAALPPGHQQQPGHQAKWLWTTLHAAELAGQDARQVLADAIGERDLTGARDIHAVIDARIRRRTATLIPLPAPPWSAQLPGITDPERDAHASQIAAFMDARKQRIGEHAATSTLAWAVTALGPVPADPPARLDWQQRAAAIGAYRELSGYHHPADPIGPEPAASRPDLRAAWHEALAAIGAADGPDVRGMTGGCCTSATPTPSKPPGHPPGRAMSSVTPAPAPATPASLRCALPQKPPRPGTAASIRKPPGSRNWPPATRPCTTPTAGRKPRTPPPWQTAKTGNTPPGTSVSWPSPPTQNCAAVTPSSPGHRRAPPNPNSLRQPSLPAPLPPRKSKSTMTRSHARSATWSPGTANSPTSSPSGRP
jgi:hypothetical protein